MTWINGLTCQRFCGERKNDLTCNRSVPKFVVGALAPKFVGTKASKFVVVPTTNLTTTASESKRKR
jgi:hypothetical protein